MNSKPESGPSHLREQSVRPQGLSPAAFSPATPGQANRSQATFSQAAGWPRLALARVLPALFLLQLLGSLSAGGAAAGTFETLDLSAGSITHGPPPGSAQSVSGMPGPAPLPLGQQTFHQIPFVLRGWAPVTGMDDARAGDYYPPRVGPLKVGRRADRLHLLVGAVHDEKDGIPVAVLRLRTADGQEHSFRLAYGVHLREWTRDRRERRETLADAESQLAWASSNDPSDRGPGPNRLYQTIVENPVPGQEIVEVEWVTLFSRSTPFLAGLTLERADPPAVSRRPQRAVRTVRKALELPEASYLGRVVVRVREEGTGRPLTNATAALTVSDDESSFYMGRSTANARGEIELVYPRQQAVSFGVLVQCPDHLPQLLSGGVNRQGGQASVFEAGLARGVRVGGRVLDAAGAPLAGATINVHQVTKTGSKEYTRIDHDLVTSGPDGRWSTASMPAGFTNFYFLATHPGQRSVLFTLAEAGGSNAPAASASRLQRDTLLAGAADLVLPGPIHIRGRVVDPQGAPVARAEVQLTEPGRPETLGPPPGATAAMGALARTDAKGEFTVSSDQSGDRLLVVRAPGYALRPQSVSAESDLSVGDVRLSPAQPFRGLVVDQNQTPIPGARVRYDGRPSVSSWQIYTDKNGAFIWESPPEGDLLFHVSATNYTSSRYSFSSSSEEQRIMLRRTSRVLGRVIDAETRKPIEEFSVIRGRAYNVGEAIRWDRYDARAGRKGEYSMILPDVFYNGGYSSSRARVLIEAPGYLPASSPDYKKAGTYTNDVELRRGRGPAGVVRWHDGSPAAGVTVVLLDSNESVEMEKPGELRRNSSGPLYQRSSTNGHFEFQPKFDAATVLAAHERGYAEMSVSNLLKSGSIVLQEWGRVEGTLAVGPRVEPGQSVVLQSASYSYQRSALELSLRADLQPDGRFVIEKAPPGDRRVALRFPLDDRESGRVGISHAEPVEVQTGATSTVRIGGTGRSIRGRVIPLGADPEDLDWKRDVNMLSLALQMPPSVSSFQYKPNMTQEEQQEAWRVQQEKQAAFWRTPEGRSLEKQRRGYVVRFESNGTFRADNVLPGQYWLSFQLTNPDRPMNYYDTIVSESFNITVPTNTTGGGDQVLDVGEFKATLRNFSRPNRKAPNFAVTNLAGQPITLEGMRGKYVLLDLWATWTGPRQNDLRVLKEISTTYGKDERLRMLGLNFDNDKATAEKAVTDNATAWPQCHVGAWNTTDLPGSLGVQGLPDTLLIDPQGKIVGRNLRGANIRTSLRNNLGAPKAP